jgi:hypothetical protein
VSEPFERKVPPGSGARSTDVFVCVSGDIDVEWIAHRIVAESGMVPIFYKGLQLADRGSNVGKEAQADLWECEAIIMAITSREADEPTQLWIYDQLEIAARRSIPIFIYVWRPQSSASISQSFGKVVAVKLKTVADNDEFAAVLREDLRAIRKPQ